MIIRKQVESRQRRIAQRLDKLREWAWGHGMGTQHI